MMIVVKYLVFSLLIVGTCWGLNFTDIKAKIEKRKNILPTKLPEPKIISLQTPSPVLKDDSDNNDTQPLNSTEDPQVKIEDPQVNIEDPQVKIEDPQVKILDSNDFPMTTSITAALVLRKSIQMYPSNPCEILRGVFQHFYNDNEWHCVEYNMVALGNRKFINMEVKGKRYLLFATNKSSFS